MTIKGQLTFLIAILSAGFARPVEAQRYFVEFDAPSLVVAARSQDEPIPRDSRGRIDLGSGASRSHLARLDAVLARFSGELAAAAPAARVERTYRILYSGAAVSGVGADVLERLPGVARVRPADTVRASPSLAHSLDAIEADALWSEVGGQESAGEGVAVAVIDTGIDVDNPMFIPRRSPCRPVTHSGRPRSRRPR